MLRLLLFVLLIAAAPAPQITARQEAAVRAALDRGALLFEVDRAGWVTTDDLIERLGGRKDVPIKGWVVERGSAPGDYVVTYFGDGAAGPVAWYSALVRDRKVVSAELYPEASRPSLTASQLRLKEAGDAARGFTQYRPCTAHRFNVAVIPPAEPDKPIDVYLLSAQTEADIYPFGGHYLVRVDAGKMVSHRRFMNTCMNMDIASTAEQGSPEGLGVTHLLDPTPTEIHVFMSIWTEKPIYVGTKDKAVWVVEGTRIRLIAQD